MVTEYEAGATQEPACSECVSAAVERIANRVQLEAFRVYPMPECRHCHTPLVRAAGLVHAGRPSVWCDDSCRKAASRLTVLGRSS
jgi:hypothetical protein